MLGVGADGELWWCGFIAVFLVYRGASAQSLDAPYGIPMFVDFTQFTGNQAYFALTQSVIPRPIAWVLSDSGEGSYNLAPYSFFNAICGEPPLVMISVGRKAGGERKDTWVNIQERGEFVIHILPREMASVMVASSATLPHGDSELTRLDLKTAAVSGQRLPRVVGPRLAMFCTLHQIIEVGDGPQGLILGRVSGMYVDDAAGSVTAGRLMIDAAKVDPVARLGGIEYSLFGEIQKYERPR